MDVSDQSEIQIVYEKICHDNQCSICLENRDLNDEYFLPCNHSFCFDCIYNWSLKKPECPMCLKGFFMPDLDVYKILRDNQIELKCQRDLYMFLIPECAYLELDVRKYQSLLQSVIDELDKNKELIRQLKTKNQNVF